MCSCLESLGKYFLFFTNLIVSVLSIVAFGLSIWILVDSPSFVEVLSLSGVTIPIFTTGGIVMLCVSIFTFFLSCFGCVGAIKESKCMLATYSTMVFVIFVLIITGTVLAFQTDFAVVRNELMKSLVEYDPESRDPDDKALVEAWDNFQSEFECCGVDIWIDWPKFNEYYGGSPSAEYKPREDKKDDKNSRKSRKKEEADEYLNSIPYSEQNDPKMPESCCDPSKDQFQCTLTPTTANGNYHDGCYEAMKKDVMEHSGAIVGVSIAIFATLVLNFLISLYMCSCASRDERVSSSGKGYTKAPVRTVY